MLYLVRHATPVDESVDPERPLSQEGLKEARNVASKLSDIRPVMIFHSGKLRAEQTADVFGEFTGGHVEQANGLNPNDDPAVWVARVEAVTEDIMLVGHLPFMGKLVSMLLGGAYTGQAEFAPATVVSLRGSDTGWKIDKIVYPDGN